MLLAFTAACGADEDDDTSGADTGNMSDTTMSDTTMTDTNSDVGTEGATYSCVDQDVENAACLEISGPGAAEAAAQDCSDNTIAAACSLTDAIARCILPPVNGLSLTSVYYEGDLEVLEDVCTGTFEQL